MGGTVPCADPTPAPPPQPDDTGGTRGRRGSEAPPSQRPLGREGGLGLSAKDGRLGDADPPPHRQESQRAQNGKASLFRALPAVVGTRPARGHWGLGLGWVGPGLTDIPVIKVGEGPRGWQ